RQTFPPSVTAALVALMVALFNVAYVLVLDVGLGLLTIGLLVGAVVVLALLVRRQIPAQRRLQAALGQMQAVALQILGAVPKLRVATAGEGGVAPWGAAVRVMKQALVAKPRGWRTIGALPAAVAGACAGAR